MLEVATATSNSFWPEVDFETSDEAEDEVAEVPEEFATGGDDKAFFLCGITVFDEKLNLEICLNIKIYIPFTFTLIPIFRLLKILLSLQRNISELF